MSDPVQVVDLDAAPVAGPPGGLDWGLLRKYGPVILQAVTAIEGAMHGPVGEENDLPEVEIRSGGKVVHWKMGSLSRTR